MSYKLQESSSSTVTVFAALCRTSSFVTCRVQVSQVKYVNGTAQKNNTTSNTQVLNKLGRLDYVRISATTTSTDVGLQTHQSLCYSLQPNTHMSDMPSMGQDDRHLCMCHPHLPLTADAEAIAVFIVLWHFLFITDTDIQ